MNKEILNDLCFYNIDRMEYSYFDGQWDAEFFLH